MLESENTGEEDESHLSPEKWLDEPWAWRESNEPYAVGIDPDAEAARKAAKQSFISGNSEYPDLDFPQLDADELDNAVVRLEDYKQALKEQSDTLQTKLLRELVDRKVLEVRRHLHIVSSTQTTGGERDHHIEAAEEISAELFGDVDFPVAAACVNELRRDAEDHGSRIASELVGLLPLVESSRNEELTMTPETIRELKPIIASIFAPAHEELHALSDVSIEHEDAIQILRRMARAMGMTEADAVMTLGNALSVDGRKEIITLGVNRKKLNRQSLLTVGSHELVHLMGYYFSRRHQSDPMLKIGLPDTLSFEEGKALAVEQLLKGQAEVRGENYYIAAALRRGSLDGRKRSFRETYEIMWRRQIVRTTDTNPSSAVVAGAKSTAYQTTMRVSRGNATDTRDIAYYEGNRLAAEWFNYVSTLPEPARTHAVRLTLCTRADFANPEHLVYINDFSEYNVGERRPVATTLTA